MLAQEKLQEITPLTRQQLAELMPSAQGLLSDEPEMEHSLHALQLLILVSCLARLWQDRNDYFLAWNLTVYYSREQLKTKDFHGPDLFLVKGVENRPRPSWVVWEEGGKYPDLMSCSPSPQPKWIERRSGSCTRGFSEPQSTSIFLLRPWSSWVCG